MVTNDNKFQTKKTKIWTTTCMHNLWINNAKDKFPENITWAELGKQDEQAKMSIAITTLFVVVSWEIEFCILSFYVYFCGQFQQSFAVRFVWSKM